VDQPLGVAGHEHGGKGRDDREQRALRRRLIGGSGGRQRCNAGDGGLYLG
jgi:hypothetical protein